MIINLTRKTVLSKKPNFRLEMFLRTGIIPKNSFLKSDCLVFQSCSMAINISRLKNIEIIFTDSANSVSKIIKASESRIFLRMRKALTTLILPEGIIERTQTQLGDLIDLSAELTRQVKKDYLRRDDELIVGIPNTAMSDGTKE